MSGINLVSVEVRSRCRGKLSVFLHTNEVSRFTNERHSCTKETIDMPRLARSIPTLIGS